MRLWLTTVVLLMTSLALGQSSDILGAHDLSMSGGSRVKGRMSAARL